MFGENFVILLGNVDDVEIHNTLIQLGNILLNTFSKYAAHKISRTEK